MNYLVHDNTRRGKVFATLAEANSYCNDITLANKIIYTITETKRQVTHIYKAEDITMTTTQKILEYFKENEDIFNDCIEELDGYSGYLGDDRYYEMEMLDELYDGVKASEILYRAFHGHDADTTTTDQWGNEHRGEFNPNRTYFFYNGYGNLISTDYKDYSDRLDEYAVKEMSEHREYIDTIANDEVLTELFDELERENDE